MFFSYRTRRVLKRIFPVLSTVLVVLLVALVCWLIWLQRFVVYTPDGIVLDFGLQPPTASGLIPQRPGKDQVVVEYPNDYIPTVPPTQLPTEPTDPTLPSVPDDPDVPGVRVLSGYYLEPKAVQEDPEGVRRQMEQLPSGTAVLIRLANFWGYRYYTSTNGELVDEEDRQVMDELLAWLAESDLYVIARLPAFRDYYYAVDNVSCGLATPMGYLWSDDDRCYWLDPTNDRVLTRLCQIARELKSLGVDEVVFDDFTMPDTEEIVFSGDRREAIYNAAEILAVACASTDFAVSFVTDDYDFRLPQSNCRLYIENAEPSEVEEILNRIQTPDNKLQVVFFCGTFDNRFDGCSILRPWELAP